METFRSEDINSLLTLPGVYSTGSDMEGLSLGENCASMSASFLNGFELECSESPHCLSEDESAEGSICKDEPLFSPAKEPLNGNNTSVDSLDCTSLDEHSIATTCQANKSNYTIAFEGSGTQLSYDSDTMDMKQNKENIPRSKMITEYRQPQKTAYTSMVQSDLLYTTWEKLKNSKKLIFPALSAKCLCSRSKSLPSLFKHSVVLAEKHLGEWGFKINSISNVPIYELHSSCYGSLQGNEAKDNKHSIPMFKLFIRNKNSFGSETFSISASSSQPGSAESTLPYPVIHSNESISDKEKYGGMCKGMFSVKTHDLQTENNVGNYTVDTMLLDCNNIKEQQTRVYANSRRQTPKLKTNTLNAHVNELNNNLVETSFNNNTNIFNKDIPISISHKHSFSESDDSSSQYFEDSLVEGPLIQHTSTQSYTIQEEENEQIVGESLNEDESIGENGNPVGSSVSTSDDVPVNKNNATVYKTAMKKPMVENITVQRINNFLLSDKVEKTLADNICVRNDSNKLLQKCTELIPESISQGTQTKTLNCNVKIPAYFYSEENSTQPLPSLEELLNNIGENRISRDTIPASSGYSVNKQNCVDILCNNSQTFINNVCALTPVLKPKSIIKIATTRSYGTQVPLHVKDRAIQTSFTSANSRRGSFSVHKISTDSLGDKTAELLFPSYLSPVSSRFSNTLSTTNSEKKPVYVCYPSYSLPDLSFLKNLRRTSEGKDLVYIKSTDNFPTTSISNHNKQVDAFGKDRSLPNTGSLGSLSPQTFSHIKDWDSLSVLLPTELKSVISIYQEIKDDDQNHGYIDKDGFHCSCSSDINRYCTEHTTSQNYHEQDLSCSGESISSITSNSRGSENLHSHNTLGMHCKAERIQSDLLITSEHSKAERIKSDLLIPSEHCKAERIQSDLLIPSEHCKAERIQSDLLVPSEHCKAERIQSDLLIPSDSLVLDKPNFLVSQSENNSRRGILRKSSLASYCNKQRSRDVVDLEMSSQFDFRRRNRLDQSPQFLNNIPERITQPKNDVNSDKNRETAMNNNNIEFQMETSSDCKYAETESKNYFRKTYSDFIEEQRVNNHIIKVQSDEKCPSNYVPKSLSLLPIQQVIYKQQNPEIPAHCKHNDNNLNTGKNYQRGSQRCSISLNSITSPINQLCDQLHQLLNSSTSLNLMTAALSSTKGSPDEVNCCSFSRGKKSVTFHDNLAIGVDNVIRETTKEFSIDDQNSEDEYENPPEEFAVSPQQESSITLTPSAVFSDINNSRLAEILALNLKQKTGLLKNIAVAVELILSYNKDYEVQKQKVLKYLCPAVYNVLANGLLSSNVGSNLITNSPWKVAEASSCFGHPTKELQDLVKYIAGKDYLVGTTCKFYMFVFGLLNLGIIDWWFLHLTSCEPLIRQYYQPDALLSLLASPLATNLCEDVLITLRPLSTLPFSLDLNVRKSDIICTDDEIIVSTPNGEQKPLPPLKKPNVDQIPLLYPIGHKCVLYEEANTPTLKQISKTSESGELTTKDKTSLQNNSKESTRVKNFQQQKKFDNKSDLEVSDDVLQLNKRVCDIDISSEIISSTALNSNPTKERFQKAVDLAFPLTEVREQEAQKQKDTRGDKNSNNIIQSTDCFVRNIRVEQKNVQDFAGRRLVSCKNQNEKNDDKGECFEKLKRKWEELTSTPNSLEQAHTITITTTTSKRPTTSSSPLTNQNRGKSKSLARTSRQTVTSKRGTELSPTTTHLPSPSSSRNASVQQLPRDTSNSPKEIASKGHRELPVRPAVNKPRWSKHPKVKQVATSNESLNASIKQGSTISVPSSPSRKHIARKAVGTNLNSSQSNSSKSSTITNSSGISGPKNHPAQKSFIPIQKGPRTTARQQKISSQHAIPCLRRS
ncbi:uncharacterized protein LOC106461696 [Limulus polyphemus]|uniref:Uncharacterized protein LOC106461696 n=1 Tax=Limulus polyphemus TaxID=6850 RepID=A0ABM1SLC4_LIMPO|nr:uncharacterized protein LOC106461696 [Limulus polyphemus]